MALRRCFNCGSTSDDKYGFCVKCGIEFKEIKNESSNNRCINCGYNNKNNAIKCVKCGVPLIFGRSQKENIIITKEINPRIKDIPNNNNKKYSRKTEILIIFGYVFSILGGLIGLIISLYLITRKDLRLKRHGAIQLAILIFTTTMLVLMLLSGDLDSVMDNYTNLLNNYTNL